MSEQTRTYVHCVSALARTMPAARLNEHLDRLLPPMLHFARLYKHEQCELAESAFASVEALVYKCPEVSESPFSDE